MYYKSCEVCGIKSGRNEQGKRLFMAKFPLDEARCLQWVKAVGKRDLVFLPIEKLHMLRHVCGNHFWASDYKKKKTQLKKTAVPSVNLTRPPLDDDDLAEFPLHIYKYDPNKATYQSSVASKEHNYCSSSTPIAKNVHITDFIAHMNAAKHTPVYEQTPIDEHPRSENDQQLDSLDMPETHTTDENDCVTDGHVCRVCDTDENTFVTDPANFEILQYLGEEPIPELWLCKWCAAYLYKVDELVHWYRAKSEQKQKGVLHNFLTIHNQHIDIPPDTETYTKQNITTKSVCLVESDVEEEGLVFEEDGVIWTQDNVTHYGDANAPNEIDCNNQGDVKADYDSVVDSGAIEHDVNTSLPLKLDSDVDTFSKYERINKVNMEIANETGGVKRQRRHETKKEVNSAARSRAAVQQRQKIEKTGALDSDEESMDNVNTEHTEERANEKVGVKRKRRHETNKEVGFAVKSRAEEQQRQKMEKSKETEKRLIIRCRRISDIQHELGRRDLRLRSAPANDSLPGARVRSARAHPPATRRGAGRPSNKAVK